jgi:sugar diacid utilization regulator
MKDRASLDHCLRMLGPHVLHPVTDAAGDVALGEPVIAGPGDPLPVAPDSLLLLVGGRPGDARTAASVRAAGEQGYAAVIVQERGEDVTALASVAEASEVVLLVAPDDLPWQHLDTLLTATIDSAPLAEQHESVGIGDLFGLANAVASSVGGAVTIEDLQGRVLAYSTLPHQEIDDRRKEAILGLQTPDRPQNAAEYRRIVQAGGKVVRFDFPDPRSEASRIAVAVYAGAEPLGVIFALDSTPELGPDAAQALEEAGAIAAVHLLQARSHRDPDRRARSETLRSLLDGTVSARAAAGQLGVPLDAPAVVLAVAVTGGEVHPSVATPRVLDLVSLYCGSWHPDALCTTSGDVVYAVLPTRGDESQQRKLADDIVSTLRSSAQLPVQVAIGPVADTLDEVPASRRVADQIRRVLATADADADVATIDDVHAQVVLLALADKVTAPMTPSPGPVDRILAYDAEHGTAYASTLRAYLDAFGEAPRAAQRLSVHENTLRYRIRRMQQLFDIALDDPDERLVAWLQLRLSAGTTP